MTLIDGKATAATIKAEIAARVEEIIAAGGKRPHLPLGPQAHRLRSQQVKLRGVRLQFAHGVLKTT